MLTLLAAILGPIITGIIGNALVQRWQMLNWHAQQRQLNHKENLTQTRALFEDISTLANSRVYASRSLAYRLFKHKKADEKIAEQYRTSVAEWNRNLNAIYVRLTLYLTYEYSLRLEREIHEKFVILSEILDKNLNSIETGESSLSSNLSYSIETCNSINSSIWRITRDIMKHLLDYNSLITSGRKINYTDGDLTEFSTFDLVKLIFHPEIDSAYIIRPA